MPAGSAKVTTKGQFTLPAEVRTALGVKPGDTIEFFIHRSGEVFILPRNRPASSIIGKAARGAVAVSDEQREAAVAAAILRRGAPNPGGAEG